MNHFTVIFLLFSFSLFGQQWPVEKDFHHVDDLTFEKAVDVIDNLFPKWLEKNLDKVNEKENYKYKYMFSRACGFLRFHPDYEMTEAKRLKLVNLVKRIPGDDPVSILRILGANDLADKRLEDLLKSGALSEHDYHRRLTYHKKNSLTPEQHLNFLTKQFNDRKLIKHQKSYGFEAVELALDLYELDLADKILRQMNKNPDIKEKYRYSILYYFSRLFHYRGDITKTKAVLKAIIKESKGKDFNHSSGFHFSGDFKKTVEAYLEFIELLPPNGDYKSGSWDLPNTNKDDFNFTSNWTLEHTAPKVREPFLALYKKIVQLKFFGIDKLKKLNFDAIIEPNKDIIVEEMTKILINNPTHLERKFAIEIIFREANEKNAPLILEHFKKDYQVIKAAFKADPVKALEIFKSRIHACPGWHFPYYAMEVIVDNDVEVGYAVLHYFSKVHLNGSDSYLQMLYEALDHDRSPFIKKMIKACTLEIFKSQLESSKKYKSMEQFVPRAAEIAFSCGNIEGLNYLLNFVQSGKKDERTKAHERLPAIFNKVVSERKHISRHEEIKAHLKTLKWDPVKLIWN